MSNYQQAFGARYLFFLVSLLTHDHSGAATPTAKCDHLGTLLYEDLGCTVSKTNGRCPTAYNCPSFAKSDEFCQFRHLKLGLGEELDRSLTYDACQVGCICHNNSVISSSSSSSSTGGNLEFKASFTCAVLDCPEWLGVPTEPGCYRGYTLGSCCSTHSICPNETSRHANTDQPAAATTTCLVDGQHYKVGEQFQPQGTCLECVCLDGFTGQLQEPFCKRRNCSVQVRDADSLANNCAPIYYGDDNNTLCCPLSWVCPNGTKEHLYRIAQHRGVDAVDTKCMFGSQIVEYGLGFDKQVEIYGYRRSLRCECNLPPFVSCVQVGQQLLSSDDYN